MFADVSRIIQPTINSIKSLEMDQWSIDYTFRKKK